MPNFKSAVVFESTVTLAADPTLALQAATKQYVDNLARARGKMASVSRATNNTGISSNTLIDSVTFNAISGRIYKVTWSGGYNNSDVTFGFRWIAGPTLAQNTGASFATALDEQAAGTANIGVTIIQELNPATTGQITVGCTANGTSLTVLGNNVYSRLFLVEDIGT
jgi:hypothetical protein